MTSNNALSIALVATIALAACHAPPARSQDEVKVNGKTAAEWEAEADRDLAAANAMGAHVNTPAATPAAPAGAHHNHTATATPVAATAAGGGTLTPGTYNCIAGYGVMLTLGKMQISGNSYTFRPPTGPATSGTYNFTGTALHWSGAIGALRHDQIADSARDGVAKNSFWFHYHVTPGDVPTAASCGLV